MYFSCGLFLINVAVPDDFSTIKYFCFLVDFTFSSVHRLQIVELPDHPYFIGVQFHPEFKSRPGKPSGLFLGNVLLNIKCLSSLFMHRSMSPWFSTHLYICRSFTVTTILERKFHSILRVNFLVLMQPLMNLNDNFLRRIHDPSGIVSLHVNLLGLFSCVFCLMVRLCQGNLIVSEIYSVGTGRINWFLNRFRWWKFLHYQFEYLHFLRHLVLPFYLAMPVRWIS